MIPSTDLSKNFHSSFFSLSPLPVKFWWGLVENCKFFITKFTIFKSLKNFQKKSEIWVRKTGGVFRGQMWKNALFWKSRFFQFFLVKGTQRSKISSQSIPYLWRGVYGAFKRPKKAKNCSKNDFFQNSLKSSFFGQFCSE